MPVTTETWSAATGDIVDCDHAGLELVSGFSADGEEFLIKGRAVPIAGRVRQARGSPDGRLVAVVSASAISLPSTSVIPTIGGPRIVGWRYYRLISGASGRPIGDPVGLGFGHPIRHRAGVRTDGWSFTPTPHSRRWQWSELLSKGRLNDCRPLKDATLTTPNSQRICLAGYAGAYRSTAPRPTRGKMRLRRWPDDGRSGSGNPDAGAQSVGPTGDPRGRGESAPPRIGAPAAHFSN